ncbi:MAG: hypothetical protein OSA23_09005 [Rhodospirillales bacterium]|nr:hypothetical protein [Rhodospirillales bacterium]
MPLVERYNFDPRISYLDRSTKAKVACAVKPSKGKITLPDTDFMEVPTYELLEKKNKKITDLQFRIATLESEKIKAMDKLADQANELFYLKCGHK